MSDVREDVKAFLDGELPAARSAEVARALDADPALRAEAESMKVLSREIKSSAADPTVQGLEAALARLRPRWAWPRRLAWAGGALGALLVVGLVGAQLTRTQELAETKGADAPAAFSPQAGERVGRGVPAPAAPMTEAGALGREAITPPPPTTGPADRLVIKHANVSVRVRDTAEAIAQSKRIVEDLGGFVASSQSDAAGPDPSAHMTVRVPADRYDDALVRFRALGEVLSESSSGEDVTAQVVDIEARLRTLRVEEETYRELLRSARTIGQVLEVRERLTQVRMQIESLDAQRASLRGLAALSTINLTLTQEPRLGDREPPEDWWGQAWVGAVNALSSVGRVLGQALIYAVVFSPLWLPFVAIVWWRQRRGK